MVYSMAGRKLGMSHIFDEHGSVVPCTIIEVSEHYVVQIKADDKGCGFLQLGFEKVCVNDPRTLNKRFKKPLLGQFAKAGVSPTRVLFDSFVEDISSYSVGQQIVASDVFAGVDFIDVCSVSKGKGYQGLMKMYGFSGAGAAHGTGPIHRHGGSRGQRSTPGRVFPLNKAASRLGGDKTSVQNLKVLSIEPESCLVVVRGSIPGAIGSLVFIRKAIKKYGGVGYRVLRSRACQKV